MKGRRKEVLDMLFRVKFREFFMLGKLGFYFEGEKELLKVFK